MSIGDTFTAISVVMAGLAALLASYYSKKSIEYASRAEQSAKDANNHAQRANVLSANSWLDQYQANVRAWADEACDCISIAMHSVKADSSHQEEHLFTSLHKLSSLIDRGRWFFPNQWNQEYGQHKEPAYHGIRQPILDCLVDAYDIVKLLHENKGGSTVQPLLHCQRMFVSEMQQVLNPRRRELEVERILKEFAISETLRTRSDG